MNTIHPPFTHLPDLTVGPLVTPQIWLSTAPSHASHLPRADWSPAEVAHHTQSTHFFWGENWDPYGYIYIYIYIYIWIHRILQVENGIINWDLSKKHGETCSLWSHDQWSPVALWKSPNSFHLSSSGWSAWWPLSLAAPPPTCWGYLRLQLPFPGSLPRQSQISGVNFRWGHSLGNTWATMILAVMESVQRSSLLERLAYSIARCPVRSHRLKFQVKHMANLTKNSATKSLWADSATHTHNSASYRIFLLHYQISAAKNHPSPVHL